jgi:uncharacterized Zn finger protein
MDILQRLFELWTRVSDVDSDTLRDAEDEIKKLRSIISIPEKTLDRFERLASRMVSEGYAQGYREACNHIMRDIMEKLGEKQ